MAESTYRACKKRLHQADPDEQIMHEILLIRKEHENYGYRRIHAQLRTQGIVINHKKVQRLVQKMGIQVQAFTRKSRQYNSYKGNIGKVACNRIKRRFHSSIAHQKIATDTTEFKVYSKDESGVASIQKMYLNPFLDMATGEIVSYNISSRPTAESVMKALNQAIEATSDCPYPRIFHSDQGCIYQMNVYQQSLKQSRIRQSMSRKGNCLDNAVMENFFGILKQEIYYGKKYDTYESLELAIKRYIKYYNEKRIKKKLNWMSPVQYRLSLQAQKN